MRTVIFRLVALVLSVWPWTLAAGEVRLPAILSDHMVLQCDAQTRVWGWAAPEEKVSVSLNGQKVQTTAGKDGAWAVLLKPMKAGGPYDMTVAGKNSITVKDVLVGEVWVASGQSNMAMTVVAVRDSEKEIVAAEYPNIRLFTVANCPSPKPQTNVTGGWTVCSPKTIPWFSATAYFFGRQLHKDLNVPIGLINSSCGGTNAETWTPREAFASNPKFEYTSRMIELAEKNMDEAVKVYRTRLAQWQKATGHDDPVNVGVTKSWADLKFVDTDWKTMDLPCGFDFFEGQNTDFDGVIWFRKTIDVPAQWAGRDLELHLGVIDDYDTTYFNGKQVGSTGSEVIGAWRTPRIYKVPGAFVTAGKNVIAVRAVDIYACSQMGGPVSEMYLAPSAIAKDKSIGLAGPWHYQIEHKMIAKPSNTGKPLEVGISGEVNQPMSLYNGMIHPLTPYTIRGAIWYQGESNAANPMEYRTLFPTMIEGWRKAWGQGDFPFYFVQLANYLPAVPEPVQETSWADLREAQTMALETSNTGMAVTIDIGDAADIHPKNKQEVGRRLALWALAKTYGQKKLVYSGPQYKSMKIKGDKIRLKFDHVGGGLVVKGEKLAGFAIAGADKKFVWAEARISGDEVIVRSDKVPQPVHVRYAWANNPVANLYNKAGLPAVPFRTDGE